MLIDTNAAVRELEAAGLQGAGLALPAAFVSPITYQHPR